MQMHLMTRCESDLFQGCDHHEDEKKYPTLVGDWIWRGSLSHGPHEVVAIVDASGLTINAMNEEGQAWVSSQTLGHNYKTGRFIASHMHKPECAADLERDFGIKMCAV